MNTPTMLGNWLQGLREIRQFDNWPQVFINRLLFRSVGLCVYKRNGLEILIDHLGDDQNGTRKCLVTDMYSRYFPRFTTMESIQVLDLGANGGGFALSLVDHGFKIQKIACVEMNPQTYQRLQFNIMHNICMEKRLLNVAVWSENKVFQIAFGRGGTSESLHGCRASGATTAVEARTLDSIVSETIPDGVIHICKMDIEGAEHDVLLGDAASSIRRVKNLIIEIHPHKHSNSESLIARLKSHGFSPVLDGTRKEGDCSVWLFENHNLAKS